MYIQRRKLPNGAAYLTFDGWVSFKKGESLDFTNVARFTKRETELNPDCDWQHFGCYPNLKRGR